MKKNVLIIYTDQQRSDTLGCYNNDKVVTPNIDSIANDGTCFDRYYVTNPVCAPSRASFLSGLYPSQVKIGDNGYKMSEDIKTINHYYSEEGFKTANIGKLHFLPHTNRTHEEGDHPSYGFDVMINSDEPGCYNDDYIRWVCEKDKSQVDKVRCSLPPEAKKYGHKEYVFDERETHEPYIFKGCEGLTHSKFVTEKSIEFINETKEPFFLIAGYYAPHPPINPNESDVKIYQDTIFNDPIALENEDDFLIPSHIDISMMDKDSWQKVIRYYHALTHHVDNCVGELINTLKEKGIYEDTIIVFTTDHGEYLGDHNRVQKGMPGHDVIARVPMIIANASNQVKRVDKLMNAVDFLPTILELSNIKVPENLLGISQACNIRGDNKVLRKQSLIQHFNQTDYSTTLVTEKYKLYIDNSGRKILFDLENNPQETINYYNHPYYKDVKEELLLKMNLEIMNVSYAKVEKVAPY